MGALDDPFDRSEDDEDEVKEERIPPDGLESPSEAERNGQW